MPPQLPETTRSARLPIGPALLERLPAGRFVGDLGRLGVDGLGLLVRALGGRPAELSADDLLRRARRRTGLHELGEVQHPDGLEVACRSLQRDAGLGLFGRLVVRDALVRGVANRLRYVDARARVPQRFEVTLVPPIFVVGLPRSGTTFLHRLLSAVPEARGIPLWESRQPIADERDRTVREDRAYAAAAKDVSLHPRDSEVGHLGR